MDTDTNGIGRVDIKRYTLRQLYYALRLGQARSHGAVSMRVLREWQRRGWLKPVVTIRNKPIYSVESYLQAEALSRCSNSGTNNLNNTLAPPTPYPTIDHRTLLS